MIFRRLPILLIAVVVAFTLPLAGQLSVSVAADGNTILYSAGGGPNASPGQDACVTAIVFDGVLVFANGSGSPCANYTFRSSSFDCQLAGPHVISAYAYGPSLIHYPFGEQTVTIGPPPPSCGLTGNLIKFDITDSTPPDDRRVLLSNTHRDAAGAPLYAYPHYQNLLAKDGVIPVNVRTIIDGVPTSGIQVTLK